MAVRAEPCLLIDCGRGGRREFEDARERGDVSWSQGDGSIKVKSTDDITGVEQVQTPHSLNLQARIQ